MVSKTTALKEAKKIRARGKKAKVVYVTKGLGGEKTYMIQVG